MCAVLSGKIDAQSISIERFREGDDLVVIKCMNVGGDDNSNPRRGFGKAAVTARIVFGQERLKNGLPDLEDWFLEKE